MTIAHAPSGRAWWRERWPWFALVALSAVLHLWQLGDRSYHHDEAIHAQLSYELAFEQRYRYNPTFHGPVLYMATAATFLAAGDSDFTARLPAAAAGIALLWVAWRLRERFGGRAAWWAGLLVTISPLTLFYGRFLRMDIPEMLFASLAFLALWRAARGRRAAWVWFGVWAGLAFATKENAYVTAALFGLTLLLAAVGRGAGRSLRDGLAFATRHGVDMAGAFGVFVLVTVSLHTVGFSHPGDWFFPGKAISYWWQQHTIERVAGPWWFHLPRLAQYEFLIFGAATAWMIRRGRRAGELERALFVFGLLSVGMYIYLGEKVPWLGVHQLWAFLPLAGAQLARTMGPHGRWWSRSLAAAGLAATVAATISASFILEEITPAQDRVESLHFVQTCPELAGFAREVAAEDAAADGPLHVSASGQAVWPLRWYWRRLDVRWALPRPGDRPAAVVSDPESATAVRTFIGPGYDELEVPLRAWWLMYQGDPSAGEIARYALTRVPWTPVGSADVMVFRRHAAE
ncbi:MAG TPA: flippase activity-associated protein Agl23 [Methylomirabilota bacterium]|nr:flippase activity-associated protein Agl23 [Methylomirabilota bacterium]